MNNIKSNDSTLSALCTVVSWNGLLSLKLKSGQMFPAGEVTDFDTGVKLSILAPEAYRKSPNGVILYKNHPLMACAADAVKELVILPLPHFANSKTNIILRVYNTTDSDITVPADTVIARIIPTPFMPYGD